MDKPMVYLEVGGWAHGVVYDAGQYWLEPGWYEVLPEGKDLWRDVEMIVFKEDTETPYTGLCREYGPTFDSFREMTIYLQDCDPDIECASWQIEDLSEALIDTETISSQLPLLNSLTLDQHPLRPGQLPDSLASWCDGLADTHKDESDDSSLPT